MPKPTIPQSDKPWLQVSITIVSDGREEDNEALAQALKNVVTQQVAIGVWGSASIAHYEHVVSATRMTELVRQEVKAGGELFT